MAVLSHCHSPDHNPNPREVSAMSDAQDTIPDDLCQCGCGKPKNPKSRFLRGHHKPRNGRVLDKRGYVMILAPDHPHKNYIGYVFEHILIAEKAVGKFLPTGAEVHHVNGTRDSGPLVVCQDHGYHMLLEQRTRAYKACGHANWHRCWICKEWDSPDRLTIRGRRFYHAFCNVNYERKMRRLRKELKP
jgi:hypothetical protein